jgi:hypothetical protein
MSRLICPYSDDNIVCIMEDITDDINCSECPIKEEDDEVKK